MDNVVNKLESCKHKPIWKKFKIDQYFLHALLQNFQTCTNHILLNFYHLRVFLEFLEILICPLNDPFGFIFIEASMFMYTSLEKGDFC